MRLKQSKCLDESMENDFPPDANKQAEEVILSRKIKKTSSPAHLNSLYWTLILTLLDKYKNTWCFILTVNWTFVNILEICLNKAISLLHKLQNNFIDSDGTRKRTLNHLAKLVRLRTKWFRVPLQSLKRQISRLFWGRSSLTFRQL